MKAFQLRSPLHLFYNITNLDNVSLSIWVNDDPTAIDTTTTADYFLAGTAINEKLTFEIAELIRSENQYLYKTDFYDTKDTATYALIKAVLNDDTDTEIETIYNFIRVRDGYVDKFEQNQILYSRITVVKSDWTKNNATVTANQTDPFAGSDAFLVELSAGAEYYIQEPITVRGVHTLSVFVKSTETALKLGTSADDDFYLTYNVATNAMSSIGNDVIAYDVFDLGNDWKKISFVFDYTADTQIRITGAADLNIFNPTLILGNWLNQGASDLLLQSNNAVYTNASVSINVLFDYKLTNDDYVYTTVGDKSLKTSGITEQSFILGQSFLSGKGTIIFDTIAGVETQLNFTRFLPCEPKYTPVKVSFVNKFGIIQDLVFFKKRIDTTTTQDERYKANILRDGSVLSHVGQNQNLYKTSTQKVTLNTGLYDEDFNPIFRELLNSLYYWIDDEPALLSSSNWTEKTSVNDKTINYTFEFEYANSEINDIR